MGAAIDAADDADIVARGDAPVRPADALEGGLPRQYFRRLGIAAVGIILLEGVKRHIGQMNMLARSDRPAREADDLAIAHDRLAGRNTAYRDLVPGGDEIECDDIVEDGSAGPGRLAGDGDVLVFMQRDSECRNDAPPAIESTMKLCGGAGAPPAFTAARSTLAAKATPRLRSSSILSSEKPISAKISCVCS